MTERTPLEIDMNRDLTLERLTRENDALRAALKPLAELALEIVEKSDKGLLPSFSFWSRLDVLQMVGAAATALKEPS